jgi:BirA family biotin operon repressor/biotin-[acetyl-CoA-carboxylase] ligase
VNPDEANPDHPLTGLARRLREDARTVVLPPLRQRHEVSSTNDDALALAAAGAPEGLAVLADAQRSGRGRQGRTWFSPPGAGVYLSIVARPPAPAIPLLTLGAGVAAARAIVAATGLPVELKWPNDVVIGRPWRKLAGVLCEASGAGGAIDAVVIGIGINIRAAAYPPDLAGRATALEIELGRPVDRDALVVELLAELAALLDRCRAGEVSWIRDAWRGFARAGFGATVTWHADGVTCRGVAAGIADDGALLVETSSGRERIVAGEVLWERLK